MNAIIKPAALLAVLAILSGTTQAQNNREKDNKQKTITIRPDAASDQKYTIVVEGGKVTINGKPVDEFKSKDVDITHGEEGLAGSFGAFPDVTKGGWNMIQEPPAVPNKAMLGVKTKNTGNGALIEEVSKGSAAEKAGLKAGDIITKLNDATIDGAESLYKEVKKYEPNEKVSVTYTRDGKTFQSSVTLTENTAAVHPYSDDRAFDLKMFRNGLPDFHSFETDNKPKLGLQIQDMEDRKGVKILNVTEGTPGSKAGLLKDDIITSVNGNAIDNIDELKEAINGSDKDKTFRITYERKNKTQQTEIKFPKKINTSDL